MCRRLLGLYIVALCLFAGRATAEGDVSPEYRLKAAFIYHFTKFVTWPDDPRGAARDSIKVGVLGTDPFGEALDEIFLKNARDGRFYEIVRLSGVDDVDALLDCRIVFVGLGDQRRVSQALRKLSERPILTVGEAGGFAGQGGIIGFFVEDNKIRFEVNQRRAEELGLHISSRMLAVARTVETSSKER